MSQLFDAAWRAAAYCLHWRVIVLSLLPFLLIGGLAFGLGFFYWTDAIDGVLAKIEAWELLKALFNWLSAMGLGGLRSFVGPVVVVVLAVPVLVMVSLLAVAAFMTPAMVRLVAQRRFPTLEKRQGGSFVGSILLSVATTVLALLAILVTMPLWFIPPLVLVVPQLIWGWLTYRVMSYDVLSEHASKEERRELIQRHRPVLIGIGVLTGFLGTVPSALWAGSLNFAPLVVPLVVWLYTLVFAFSGLWFSHYGLAALVALRRERELVLVEPVPVDVATQTPPPLLPPV